MQTVFALSPVLHVLQMIDRLIVRFLQNFSRFFTRPATIAYPLTHLAAACHPPRYAPRAAQIARSDPTAGSNTPAPPAAPPPRLQPAGQRSAQPAGRPSAPPQMPTKGPAPLAETSPKGFPQPTQYDEPARSGCRRPQRSARPRPCGSPPAWQAMPP